MSYRQLNNIKGTSEFWKSFPMKEICFCYFWKSQSNLVSLTLHSAMILLKRLYYNSTLQSWLTDANTGIDFQKIVSRDDNLV